MKLTEWLTRLLRRNSILQTSQDSTLTAKQVIASLPITHSGTDPDDFSFITVWKIDPESRSGRLYRTIMNGPRGEAEGFADTELAAVTYAAENYRKKYND